MLVFAVRSDDADVLCLVAFLAAADVELDECFLARRTSRAARDAQRFDHDRPFLRPTLKPRHAP